MNNRTHKTMHLPFNPSKLHYELHQVIITPGLALVKHMLPLENGLPLQRYLYKPKKLTHRVGSRNTCSRM
jgi:hypothetical protein